MITPPDNQQSKGFALVITLSLMILLTVIAVGLLSLSAVTMRATSQAAALAQARANARLALMLAIGELQKEMGPDMRVSAEAAVFDQNPDTDAIDGVAQPHWLASYNSWGSWLNTDYALPDGGGTLRIKDTYGPRRQKMFRRWLLSLPDDLVTDDKAPLAPAGLDDAHSVVLVGKGSLGNLAQSQPEQVTRAYLIPIESPGDQTGKPAWSGKQAWWISPENHKAKVNLAKNPRTLGTDAWEAAQGDTAEVGVGGLKGFEAIDSDPKISDKLITPNTLRPAKVAADTVAQHFFDLTADSQGLLTSVRTGQLKKDLSLLFEKSNSNLPAPYKFNIGSDIREPSIRPMTAELTAKNPTIPNRQFASWTNMRHFYRMYRGGSDATIGGTGGAGSLNWTGSKPWTDHVSTDDLELAGWDGSNNYWRFPILAKLTFIFSLLTSPSSTQPGKYDCFVVYTPIFTFWNPYNTELRLPDNALQVGTSAYHAMPCAYVLWTDATTNGTPNDLGMQTRSSASIRNDVAGQPIVFKPGEFRIFSLHSLQQIIYGTAPGDMSLMPGFDPQAIGGDKQLVGTYSPPANPGPGQGPGVAIEFSGAKYGTSVNDGNTAGSIYHQANWQNNGSAILPMIYANDWFIRGPSHTPSQTYTPMTAQDSANVPRWLFDNKPLPIAYAQMVIKASSPYSYESINWGKDWRCRNWIQAPPFYFGSQIYISANDTIAHTQRLDCPYVMNFGPTDMPSMPAVVPHLGSDALLGSGSNPYEQITSAAMLELPSAPIASLAGFSNMRIKPGWLKFDQYNPDWKIQTYHAGGYQAQQASLYAAETKAVAYQSGITGPAIGNSFMHPMLPRDDIYRFIDNSKSQDPPDRLYPYADVTETIDTKAYCDYWDHVFLLNDALWDDYFVSSLADQTRPGAGSAKSLSQNIDNLVADQEISNTRYRYYPGGQTTDEAKAELLATDAYLKAAKHLVVDGMFNVNSTSVAAWQALFAGIRERQLVFRDSSGTLRQITVPSGKRIAISRFDTEVSDQEMTGPEYGVKLPDGSPGWSGVRFLDDDQLLKLAEQCVKQVKLRGPFLNFSEFINRRLSNDDLGLMGALQSAIDYDDKAPDARSINYRFKNGPDFMLRKAQLGTNSFSTPEAAEGSRFAGIPGYVIQSDLLKPIANTLAVRDDTFRIRAYGEALDHKGKVIARAWCEAVVQRGLEYCDPANEADVAPRELDASGAFNNTTQLTPINLRFGRKFRIESFRWLNGTEV